MDWYNDYRLVTDGDGYTVEIYLNNDSTEFAKDFMSNSKENSLQLDEKIKKLVDEKFTGFKINSVKLMVGTVLVATIPFAAASGAQAATTTPASTEPQVTTQSTNTVTLNTTGTVTSTQLNMRSGPATSYPSLHVLWQGNSVKVIGESGDWYKIQLSDGRTGWVSKSYLQVASSGQDQTPATTPLNTTGVVTATRLNMRSGPASTYPSLHLLWQGNSVKVIGESGDWYKIQLSDGRTGWVSKSYLQVGTSSQQKINTVIATAKSFLGTPYVWGGESPQEGGFDCSGLTQYSFKQAGYQLNRISADQARQGIAVSRSNIQPGDLVFYGFNGDGAINHVGIYIGNGQMINSPKTGDVVKVTQITTSYWESRFVTARRIIY